MSQAITDIEILRQFGNEIIAGIKINLADTASHLDTFLVNENNEASNSLHQNILGSDLTVLGYQYIDVAERGRDKTVNPGDGALRRAVLRYIEKYSIAPYVNKKTGISFTNEETAFFISRSIHKGGTSLFKSGGNSGVLSSVITPERVDALKDAFASKYAEETKSDILIAFK